ncbi:type II toxin-antitoxin system RelE/ParE family toxin [Pseudoalteromonas sp. MMG022]|uniref:type II toxin-antitoxin system RelE/ParE family toxin n=1 Tax=Pseudoalteromonas sp. MMG022 TaxID=2909978 RepID=UPI001F417975|nr:type II toxin-antitoxin system RelE/ParE family toxin [Pseudoalteromonas sp. MMG022]MCF6437007.1 type II toxin-antitoxin system RelE/ParE family toxin [Pseudoalteromonas sp. MMG022]
MSREVIWLPDAVKDVMRLREFIREKNPSAAQRAASRIKEGVMLLMDNPESGRPVAGLSAFREVMMPFGAGNYVLRYREDGNKVVIVRVWHSKEARR